MINKLFLITLLLPTILFAQAGYDKKQEGFYLKHFDLMGTIAGCSSYDERIFRGGQPDLSNSLWLERLALEKITYVIDLRKEAKLTEEKLVLQNGMGYILLPLTTTAPEQPKIVKLRITHPNQQTTIQEMDTVDATIKVINLINELTRTGNNVFVHCMRGEDRTGTLLGLMRKCPDWKNEFKKYGGSLYPSLSWLYNKVVIRESEF